MKKKVLVICPHPVGYAPGQRLKYEQYFSIFEKHGYEITVSPFMSEAFQNIVYKKGRFLKKIFWTILGLVRRVGDLFRLKQYDIVYVFLWVSPFGPAIFEKLTCKIARKVVYDIDDLVFLTPASKPNPFVHLLRSRSNYITMMKEADHVITCTPYLTDFAKKYNSNITDISSTINTTAYLPRTNYDQDGPMIIGWSGSYSTARYLHLLDNVFTELAKTHNFKLLVMGDESFQLDGVNVEARAWKEEYEIDVIRSFDIGVYPLPDEEWVYGKSGLKALQYMSVGVPTVATAIGTIFRIIRDGENGFLVKNEEEWKHTLSGLMQDAELRRRIGQKAVDTVERDYSVNANKDRYLDIFNRLVNNK